MVNRKKIHAQLMRFEYLFNMGSTIFLNEPEMLASLYKIRYGICCGPVCIVL